MTFTMRDRRDALIAQLVFEHAHLYRNNAAFREAIDALADELGDHVDRMAIRASVKNLSSPQVINQLPGARNNRPLAFDDATWDAFRNAIRAVRKRPTPPMRSVEHAERAGAPSAT